MRKNRLIVGGYSCIRAVKSYIDQAIQENDRILINASLLSRIEKIADDSDEIRKSRKRGQIVTLSYKSSPADIVLDDIIIKHYGEANMQVIDVDKYMSLFPESASIEKRRSLVGITVNAYRNIPELMDITVAYELHADSIVYFDMKYLSTVFSKDASRNTGIQITRKSLTNEVWQDAQGAVSVEKETCIVCGCEGVYDSLVSKYINTSEFEVVLIKTKGETARIGC